MIYDFVEHFCIQVRAMLRAVRAWPPRAISSAQPTAV
jgi:hypothetical protein